MLAVGEAPHDPRSRAVTAIIDEGHGAVTVRLECGHVMRRRPMCPLSRAICPQCRAIAPDLPAEFARVRL